MILRYAAMGIIGGLVVLLALCLVSDAHAAPPYPMTLTVCKSYTVGKRGDGAVVIRCPGMPIEQPFFVITPGCCPNPRVPIRTATTVTIDCG